MNFKLRYKLTFLILILTQIIIGQNTESQQRLGCFKTIAPRFGFGIHNYPNFELGVSALDIQQLGIEFGAASLYSTFVAQQSDWKSKFDILGFKIGVQSSWAFLMWGIEWKNLNYEHKNFNYLSPKVGLSFLDIINIEYLINVLDIKNSYPLQSKHQISINFSLNRKIYNNVLKK